MKAGQTVILDNASFRKSAKTRQLVEAQACKLLYLPTYLPDLNPIEQQWASLKAGIRKCKAPEQPLDSAIEYVFKRHG
jgi:transposase